MTKAPNDGGREVGQEVFERVFILRCDCQFKTVFGDVLIDECRDNSLVAQTLQEFRNNGTGAAKGEKLEGSSSSLDVGALVDR